MANEINTHLANGGYVTVTTGTRQTVYSPKHAGWFSDANANGVYVRHGNRRVFVFAYAIRLHNVRN